MRTMVLMNYIAQHVGPNLDLDQLQYFMTVPSFNGGWEQWFQATMAFWLAQADPNNSFDREVGYPDGQGHFLSYSPASGLLPASAVPGANLRNAARADFTVSRVQGAADITYLELKCKKSSETNFQQWERFGADWTKTITLTRAHATLNCTSLIVTYGTFTQQDLDNLDQLWSAGHVAGALDFSPGQGQQPLVTPFKNVALGGADRIFIIGAGL